MTQVDHGVVLARPVISGAGLTKSYGRTAALHHASLKVDRGESVAVMGPSGSGKSTLLYCLSGVLTPDSGDVFFNGVRVNELSDARRAELRRSDFGFVFQFPGLLPELPADENVALPLMLAGVGRRDAVTRARELWLRSSNAFVSIAFTAVVILGWGLVSTGPWMVGGLGRLLARGARRPATLLAGRRLADSPRSAWRTVGGMTLAAFIAGFVAISLPAGLGNVGQYASRTQRLDVVVPAASLDATVREAAAVLRADDIQADVQPTSPPSWLDEDEWATLSLTTRGLDTERDRVRTAMIENRLWGPEMTLAEDLPNMWLLRDGVVMGFLVLPIAALVALTSMVIGAIARILDQRETLVALRLAGTPQTVLLAAQRREMILPTALLGGLAAVAGLASGSALGSAGLLNPYTAGIFASLLTLGATALLLADRTARPVLERTGTDLSERE